MLRSPRSLISPFGRDSVHIPPSHNPAICTTASPSICSSPFLSTASNLRQRSKATSVDQPNPVVIFFQCSRHFRPTFEAVATNHYGDWVDGLFIYVVDDVGDGVGDAIRFNVQCGVNVVDELVSS
ncbi:hypothetical protein MRB53_015166 [Persea americana]|uniref:Uncharacterized protein n=1 Tax=Persea americana TaxID=3435 RepID=A0ACC2KCX8_PERAE|nr:hypothetical protein MRB53_015166 [Persea americana]